MNFLKKKIKNVVHGKRNKDDEDDDDFDNYVPAVPPHPSTLAPEASANAAAGANDSFVANFNSFNFDSITSAADTAAKSLVSTLSGAIPDPLNPLGPQGSEGETEPPKPISLEELKAREEEHKREEKEKVRQQEESKKDSEDWKYFLSLTAKVDAVTSKTQSSLTKLKDESAINEISQLEDPCFADQFDESAPKTAGGWIAFGENDDYNPADPIFTEPPPQEVVTEEVQPEPTVIDEGTQQLAQELIDAFGFTNPAPGIPALVPEKNLFFETEENNIDPFDTSFIDVDAIKSGKAIDFTEQNTNLIQNLDFTDTSFDPFDTTHVEEVINTDLLKTDSAPSED